MIPVHDSIPSVVAELLRNQPLSPAKIEFAWQAAVGPAMARATSPTLSDDGELSVVVSDHHWKREVSAAAPLIVPRLERLLGAGVVRKVVVRRAGRESHPSAGAAFPSASTAARAAQPSGRTHSPTPRPRTRSS